MAIRTIAFLIAEARTLLQDTDPVPSYRYTDVEMLQAFNGAMSETRVKRPDLFLELGLRNPVPYYGLADLNAPFPLDSGVYSAFVFYIVGRSEMREDVFTEDGRASTLMAKFIQQLLTVAS